MGEIFLDAECGLSILILAELTGNGFDFPSALRKPGPSAESSAGAASSAKGLGPGRARNLTGPNLD